MTEGERMMTLGDAAKLLCPQPSVSTLWRWCRRGVRGVRLEYRRLGRRIVTSAQAIERFGSALAEKDGPPPIPMGENTEGEA